MPTGKTTSLIERAIEALSELPDDEKVYITGAHANWVRTLSRDFQGAGLTDVVFMSVGLYECWSNP